MKKPNKQPDNKFLAFLKELFVGKVTGPRSSDCLVALAKLRQSLSRAESGLREAEAEERKLDRM